MAEKNGITLGEIARVVGNTSLSTMLAEGGVITRPLARCIISCLPSTQDAHRQADEAKRRVVHLLEKRQEQREKTHNAEEKACGGNEGV
jgi:hypothetical protein